MALKSLHKRYTSRVKRMKLSIQVSNLIRDKKSGIWKYRRRVPQALKLAVGKGEIWESLKTKDEAVAIARYPAAHERAEAVLRAAGAVPRETLVYEATLNDLKQAGLIDGSATEVPPIPIDYDAKFKKWTDAILEVAESQPESQLNGPLRRDNPVLRMAVAQFRGVKKPQATLSEAVEHYLSQKITTFNERDLRKQVGLVQKLLSEVSGTADPRLDEITLDVAEAFRERMLAAGNSPATVKRRITTIKAVLNRFIKDKRLKPEVENYFNGLEVRDVGGPADRDRRDALSIPDLAACAVHFERGNDDLRDTWLLQMFTGARPTELSGLTWDDVRLNGQVPYLVLRHTETRRVKGKYSVREVPIVGKALEMMQRRDAGRVAQERFVFPRYASAKGRAALSASQIKKMKAANVWVLGRKVPYSLRHSMKDWMTRSAGHDWAEMLLGHTVQKVSGGYGSDTFLDLLAAKVEQSLKDAGVWDYPDIKS